MIAESRQDSHRLGVAVQIWTIRYIGLPPAVPWPVVDYLAEQLRSQVGLSVRLAPPAAIWQHSRR
ncbi:DUF4158 domain-containing protein [Nonomuraea harbinensis]|uniref:DUF4158 domain-containing protein n=1 Tax=Nonomuraea harbinensis TaxID=1286938 RepID=A0ABW1C8Q8_9ACTN|nr:DUF4158 domain-containing protein [Nonomuraea harbinensis]